jgi:hypothetical protein
VLASHCGKMKVMEPDDTRFDTDPLPDLSEDNPPEGPPGFDSLVENAVSCGNL